MQKDSSPNPDFKKISQEKNTAIIDVRTIEEFESGHIQSSMNIPLDVLTESVENFKKYDNIILVCRSGNRSGKAKVILEEHGLKNVYNGGAWDSLNKTLQ